MCVCVPPGPKSSIEDFRVIAYSGPVVAEGSKPSIGHFRVIVNRYKHVNSILFIAAVIIQYLLWRCDSAN